MSLGAGRWQRAILTALEAEPEGIILAWIPDPDTADAPTNAGYSARQRAAKTLAANELCRLVRVWALNYIGVRMCMVMVLPPDAPDPLGMVRSRYESRPRKLSVEAGESTQVQHIGNRP